MRIFRSVISFVLLIVYSVSFAHDLIPHSHFNETTNPFTEVHEIYHHHLENHTPTKTEDFDENDNLHPTHLEGSLFDFLVSVFSKLVHLSGLSHHHYLPQDDNSKNEFSKIKLAATFIVVFNKSETLDSPQFFDYHTSNYPHYPGIVSAPHRGPPTLS